jgi:ectoine hydroxylase-related dioxygenase (phytanoyl-CoA dioxygenase family)
MRIIPGVFREKLEHTRDPDSDHHIRCYPNEEDAVLVELPAGGALFFAYGTPHATGANLTDNERAGVALHFLNVKANGSAIGGFDVSNRPILTGPVSTGGEREYGEKVAGTWDAEVERLLTPVAL